jgi:NAD dependent epimerase/dehydratase family enzyme
MVMARGGGAFDMLSKLTRAGLGGSAAGGSQYMSWIHERDFVRSIGLLLERDDIKGVVNLAAPNPLPQRDFIAALRAAWKVPVGLPVSRWMLAIGAPLIGTDPELILKSRRIVSQRLLEAGFAFEFPEWPAAARDLVSSTHPGGNPA